MPKADGSFRFCTDSRKVNFVTLPDSFPLQSIDNCFDNLGVAKYITKLDLLNSYWQMPLTECVSEVSAFVTPGTFLQCTQMAFVLQNTPTTFQSLMLMVLGEVPNCSIYLDDVIYSSTWAEHMSTLYDVFHRLPAASLKLNIKKCEFAKASVTWKAGEKWSGTAIGWEMAAVLEYPVPITRRELRRFWGMVGYSLNFSSVVAPLTRLCSPKVGFSWTDEC